MQPRGTVARVGPDERGPASAVADRRPRMRHDLLLCRGGTAAAPRRRHSAPRALPDEVRPLRARPRPEERARTTITIRKNRGERKDRREKLFSAFSALSAVFSSYRKSQVGAAAAAVGAVVQRQRAAVGFGDLTAQHEADAGSTRFGGEEGHEQVRRVGQPRSLIVDPQLETAALAFPADRDAATGL